MIKRLLLGTIFGFLFAFTGMSQITTASMRGTVSDGEGTLPGATVVAIHTPSGTQYGTITQDDGSFNIPNMRIGGPYTVQISFIGYGNEQEDGIYLKIGEKLKLYYSLKDEGTLLDEVVVLGESAASLINSGRTGSSTNIDNESIKSLPTISRSINDFTRLTPGSDGLSFGGRNSLMNNLSLDGSIFNSPFGLGDGTPGGQTGAQPISLDAIEQIQVELAPYDVTLSGFTGASINAVTKSGTNTFHGALFGYYRNQDLTGTKVGDAQLLEVDLKHLQTGFSLGGPIIKNKLFFFVNAEIERRSDLSTAFRANRGEATGDGISRVLATDLELVSNLLSGIGYDTGLYEDILLDTDNEKFIAKLDWNINANHSLTATYNSLNSSQDKNAHPVAFTRRGPDQTTLQFANSGYAQNNNLKSGIVELKSRFGNKFSNNLQVGFTNFDDFRDAASVPAPPITIRKDGVPYIIAGHEPFSIHNVLDQQVIQITNNFKIYSGKHLFTIGGSFEKFSFQNSFNLFGYGLGALAFANYQSVADFETAVGDGTVAADIASAQASFENNNEGTNGAEWSLAESNMGQIALYGQDEFSVSNDFTLTLGLRIDKPMFFNTSELAAENIERVGDYDDSIDYFDADGTVKKYDSTVLPSESILFSPRLGFNWNVNGQGKRQIRGGVGVFTGRLPFVWIGNQIQNLSPGFYTPVNPDFKFPQVLRANVGVDQKLGSGIAASFDAVYNKDINAIFASSLTLNTPGGTLQGPGARPIYRPEDQIGGGAWQVTNSDVGNSINFTVQLKKIWNNGLRASLAYDYLNAKDASSPVEAITNNTFGINPAFGNVNTAVSGTSHFGHKNRIVGSVAKTFEYGKGNLATSIAVFFEYTESGRFTYTYGGDINRDGSGQNDILYVPTASEIGTMGFSGDAAAQADQRTALESFIQQDNYLNDLRGSFVERNGNLAPWFSTWDIRIAQDFNFGHTESSKIQFTADILNFGNLISSDWGIRQLPSNSQPIGVSVDEAGLPTYSFDSSLTSTFTNNVNLLSRWQVQFGLRYNF